MIIIASREEKELLERLRGFERDEGRRSSTYMQQVASLRAEIETLTIERDRKKEQHERQERELRHMIGLEKKRQEVEIEQAKKETSLTVREANLAADTKRFEEQLKFNTARFETMEKYLKEMLADILARLPNVNLELKRGK